MSENAAAARPKRHRTIKIDENAGPPRATARVCEAASCISGNASDITARLRELTAEQGDVSIKRVGCLGLRRQVGRVKAERPDTPPGQQYLLLLQPLSFSKSDVCPEEHQHEQGALRQPECKQEIDDAGHDILCDGGP